MLAFAHYILGVALFDLDKQTTYREIKQELKKAIMYAIVSSKS
jgi:hypothetical protein